MVTRLDHAFAMLVKRAIQLLATMPTAQLRRFCQQWQIRELALFGSVLRDDFRADSDVDVLVTFADNARWSLLDLVRMKEQLEVIFQRPVDLVTRRGIEQSANQAKKGKNPPQCSTAA
jgi:hypothetical protein